MGEHRGLDPDRRPRRQRPQRTRRDIGGHIRRPLLRNAGNAQHGDAGHHLPSPPSPKRLVGTPSPRFGGEATSSPPSTRVAWAKRNGVGNRTAGNTRETGGLPPVIGGAADLTTFLGRAVRSRPETASDDIASVAT